MYSSVSWTSAAMMRMKATMRRYSSPSGTSSHSVTMKLATEASVSTKAVATDMPKAEETLLDTPMNGHSPRNCTSTKLLTSAADMTIRARSMLGGTQLGMKE